MGDRRIFRSGRVRAVEPGVERVHRSPVVPLAPVAAVGQGSRPVVTVHGYIEVLDVVPRGTSLALVATVAPIDGETSIRVVWLGRKNIRGIHVGREIVASARLCAEGALSVMYNPRYDLR